MIALASTVVLFFLFPDGRAVPRWTRFAVGLTAIAGAAFFLSFVLLPQAREALEAGVADLLIIGFFAAALVAQVQRYRFHSTTVQRQQTKWVLFGLAGTVLSYLVWVLTFLVFPFESGAARLNWNLFGLTGLGLLFTALPISLAVSILRCRLFDIDILIKRTLIYGTLTAAVLGVYFGSVVLLQAAFRAIAGQGSPLAIVASTLVIAALFNPLRRRIQTAVDRRFYRGHYDAARALASFGEALRDEVDLERMQTALMSTVQRTMQPTALSLWMREGARAGLNERARSTVVLREADGGV